MPISRAAGTGTPLALALLVAVASGAAAATAAPAQGAGRWVRVEPRGEGFSVMMPSKPDPSSDEVAILGNKYRMSMYTSVGPDGLVYATVMQELPTIVTALRPREKLDQFMSGFKEGLGGEKGQSSGITVELTLRRELDLKGRAGRLYALSVAETPGLLHVYDGGRRVYVLMVFGTTEPTASVKRFFDSFGIKGAEAPPPPPPKPTPRGAAPAASKPAETPSHAPPSSDAPMLFPPDDRPIHYGNPKPDAGVGDRPLSVKDVTKKAVLLTRPEPGFTEEARRNNVSGVVKLRVVLAADGRVSNISVVKGLPDGLTERAIAAARRIQFVPAQKDGRNVSQWVTVEYNFNIYDYEESDPRVTTKSVILEKPEPAYTEEARREKVEGKVVLRVLLSHDGKARVVNTLQTLPHGLTEQAVEAAERIKFKPAEVEGRPVSVTREIEYVFALK